MSRALEQQTSRIHRHGRGKLTNSVFELTMPMPFLDQRIQDVVEGRSPGSNLESQIRIAHAHRLTRPDAETFYRDRKLPAPGKSTCELRYDVPPGASFRRSREGLEILKRAQDLGIDLIENKIRRSCEQSSRS